MGYILDWNLYENRVTDRENHYISLPTSTSPLPRTLHMPLTHTYNVSLLIQACWGHALLYQRQLAARLRQHLPNCPTPSSPVEPAGKFPSRLLLRRGHRRSYALLCRPLQCRSYFASRLLGGAVEFRRLVSGWIQEEEIVAHIKAEAANVVGRLGGDSFERPLLFSASTFFLQPTAVTSGGYLLSLTCLRTCCP